MRGNDAIAALNLKNLFRIVAVLVLNVLKPIRTVAGHIPNLKNSFHIVAALVLNVLKPIRIVVGYVPNLMNQCRNVAAPVLNVWELIRIVAESSSLIAELAEHERSIDALTYSYFIHLVVIKILVGELE